MKTYSVVFPRPGRVELIEEELPRLNAGEVICQAERSLISVGTELQCLRGIFDPGTNWENWVKYPFRPGYCMASRVVEIGSGVGNLKIGQLVSSRHPHRQFFVARAEELIPVPDEVASEEAAWVPVSLTAQQGVRRAALVLGETVGVVGLGIIGQSVVEYVRLLGPRWILGIDTSSTRVKISEAGGFTTGYTGTAETAFHAVADMTEGRMLDVLFEITGNPRVLESTIPLVRTMGKIVLIGDTSTPTRQNLGPGVVSNSISIIGSHLMTFPEHPSVFSPWGYQEMAQLFFKYLISRRINVRRLISHVVDFRSVPELYARIESNRSEYVGILIDWSK